MFCSFITHMLVYGVFHLGENHKKNGNSAFGQCKLQKLLRGIVELKVFTDLLDNYLTEGLLLSWNLTA